MGGGNEEAREGLELPVGLLGALRSISEPRLASVEGGVGAEPPGPSVIGVMTCVFFLISPSAARHTQLCLAHLRRKDMGPMQSGPLAATVVPSAALA